MPPGNAARVTFGSFLGGGLDVHVTHAFSIAVSGGYNLMANFSEPVGLRDNFNGPEVAISIGWLFGKSN